MAKEQTLECLCNQFQSEGKCSHIHPHDGPRYRDSEPVPRAVHRMHNRLMSDEERKEKDGKH